MVWSPPVRNRKSEGMPSRVDVAYGEEVKAWRLHFSVGFVF